MAGSPDMALRLALAIGGAVLLFELEIVLLGALVGVMKFRGSKTGVSLRVLAGALLLALLPVGPLGANVAWSAMPGAQPGEPGASAFISRASVAEAAVKAPAAPARTSAQAPLPAAAGKPATVDAVAPAAVMLVPPPAAVAPSAVAPVAAAALPDVSVAAPAPVVAAPAVPAPVIAAPAPAAVQDPVPAPPVAPPASEPFSLGNASSQRGSALFQTMNCLACHRVQGRGGMVAPDLWEVGNRREASWIFKHFKDPQGVSPGTMMPRFPLSDDQFRDLTAYLLTLR